MEKKPQAFEGAVFADDRGVFSPFLDAEKNPELFKAMGGIKRVYYVYNHAANVVRGFHYHEKEWKIFGIVAGAAKFVAVNPKNPEEKFTFISSERKNQVIVIPPGFANGWVSLEPNTVLICASNATTNESRADDKRFDPFGWGDVWTVQSR
ncbi:MAG: hypothetical protein FJY98_00475 [Candidatus Liptonbacteria bacterium]|nr:hypothetical protein [Candidatus Liptonbacteria bacterium]